MFAALSAVALALGLVGFAATEHGASDEVTAAQPEQVTVVEKEHAEASSRE